MAGFAYDGVDNALVSTKFSNILCPHPTESLALLPIGQKRHFEEGAFCLKKSLILVRIEHAL